MIVKLKNVRLAFPNLFTPQSVNGSDPKFNCVFLIDKKDKSQITAIESAMKDAAVTKWGEKGEATLAKLKKEGRVCLKDGDGVEYDGYEGCMSMSASRDSRPMVLDRDKSPLTSADGRPYAGCYINGSVEIWAQDNKFGKRINAQLRGVQFFKDGDSFGGGTPPSEEEFDDLADGSDAEEDDMA